jgi:amino acid permease
MSSYAVPFPLVAAASIMEFWVPNINPAVWVSLFCLIPIGFNFFNVRRYGAFEFYLTSIKVIACVGIMILGILLPMDASPDQRLLGTDLVTHQLIPCDNSTSTNGQCLPTPGFNCITL